MLRYSQIIFLGFLLMASQLVSQNHQTIDSLKKTLNQAETDTTKINLLAKLAEQYSQFNIDTTIIYLRQAIDKAREIDDQRLKASLFMNLGKHYAYKAEYIKALEHLNLAEDILMVHPDIPNQALVHYYKSVVFININKLESASDEADKTHKLYQKTNDSAGLSSIYRIYSIIFDELGDSEKAIKFNLKSYYYEQSIQDFSGLSTVTQNLSMQYLHIKKFDSAFFYLKKSIELNKGLNSTRRLAGNYQHMSLLFFQQNQLDSSEYYLQKASEYYRKSGYLITQQQLELMHVDIELARSNTSKAIQHLHTVINSPSELSDLNSQIKAYKTLADIAIKQERFSDATFYLQKYKQFDDSLKNKNNTSLVTVLEMQMDYDKQKNKMEIARKELELKSQKKSLYLFLLGGIALLLITAAYFIILLQRIKAQKAKLKEQKLKEELDSKNRVLVSNVMALMKKNELMSKISQKLLTLKEGAIKDETKESIRKIANEIINLKNTELCEEFDTRFKQVHVDFYKSLLKICPDLSPAEQRICAFLKLNMSSKDISDIMNIELKTINNTRYKIRKKLNIDSKTNLVTFLSKI